MYRVIHFRSPNRATTVLLALAAIVLGGVFLVLGLALLAGLAAAGAVIGTGMMLYARLTGRSPRIGRRGTPRAGPMAPELEVFPDGRDPIPHSRFPIPPSRFPIPHSRFPIP